MNACRQFLAGLALLLAVVLPVRAQMPDPGEGRELWRGLRDGRTVRIVLVPKQATALIPLRFLIEEVNAPAEAPAGHTAEDCPTCNIPSTLSPVYKAVYKVPAKPSVGTLLDEFDAVEVHATGGAEATLSYTPQRLSIQQWKPDLAEVREVFRAPGTYEFTLLSDAHPDWRVTLPIEVGRFAYIGFGEEFGLFVAGCLLLGAVFVGVIVYLHRRIPPSGAISGGAA